MRFQQAFSAAMLTSLASAGTIGLAGSSPNLVALESRSLVALGGWSLSATNATCPQDTATCFSNQTGIIETSNRGEECCPYGTTPELRCGTYVNTGQPYACCPIDNPDCRGDVEKQNSTNVCANSGWALWYIPDEGYNRFCCLPGQYGYWYPSLGQDAVGQCSSESTLPSATVPGVQVDNGDGSVAADGSQISALPSATPTPAPVCDITHYGWSLQTNDSSCTAGSSLCSNYGGACCPNSLNCGTVVGDSEVPVCCPADNPDCRGDVEGLWPQVCSDSSWALWHVNTNGNHFCCLPGQIGYNIIEDNAAVGYCGDAVPTNTNITTWMRSILDYEGDGSTAGSFENFPCDTSPAPNASWPSILGDILNPPPGLNAPGYLNGAGYPNSKPLYPNVTATMSFIKPTLTVTLDSPHAEVTGDVVVVWTTIIDGVECTQSSTQVSYPGATMSKQIVSVETTTINGVATTKTATILAPAEPTPTAVSVTFTTTINGVAKTMTTVSMSTPAATSTGATVLIVPTTINGVATTITSTQGAASASGTATSSNATTSPISPATGSGSTIGSSFALLALGVFAAIFL